MSPKPSQMGGTDLGKQRNASDHDGLPFFGKTNRFIQTSRDPCLPSTYKVGHDPHPSPQTSALQCLSVLPSPIPSQTTSTSSTPMGICQSLLENGPPDGLVPHPEFSSSAEALRASQSVVFVSSSFRVLTLLVERMGTARRRLRCHHRLREMGVAY